MSTTRYLSISEFADRIGVKVGTISRYNLPEADVLVGTVRGWSVETIDAWNESRPGSGRWGRRSASTPAEAPKGRNAAATAIEKALGVKVVER